MAEGKERLVIGRLVVGYVLLFRRSARREEFDQDPSWKGATASMQQREARVPPQGRLTRRSHLEVSAPTLSTPTCDSECRVGLAGAQRSLRALMPRLRAPPLRRTVLEILHAPCRPANRTNRPSACA